jgi:muconate cycloisomerase
MQDWPIRCVEQPLSVGAEDQLAELKRATRMPLMYDESLVTRADADRLIELGVVDAFNIRLSKNGGFLPALRLA